MPEFRVRAWNLVRERKQLVLHGQVLAGLAKPGMTILLSLNRSTSIAAEVAEVTTYVRDGGSETTVIVQCESRDELDVWKFLRIGEDEVLQLKDTPQ